MKAAVSRSAMVGASSAAAAVICLASPDVARAADTTELNGALGSFRLKPDGVDWERFEGPLGFAVRRVEDVPQPDRVYCVIQERASDDAKPGETPPAALANELGDSVIAGSNPSFKTEYVSRFEPKSFGPNPGLWAEFKAEGERPPSRTGIFLVAAKAFFAAVWCAAPMSRWDETKPKIETLLSRIEIVR